MFTTYFILLYNYIQIQHLLKLNTGHTSKAVAKGDIQIQHLLKLNLRAVDDGFYYSSNSNTTLVKVKFIYKFATLADFWQFKYNTC